MQRMSLAVAASLAALGGASGCAAQAAPPHPPQIVETFAHQPGIIRISHHFICSPTSEVRLEWGRRIRSAEQNAAGQGGAEVTALIWSGRQPSSAELSVINAAVAPFTTPRAAEVSCGGERNVLMLEFWEQRAGATRIAIEMDSTGFRLVRPPSP